MPVAGYAVRMLWQDSNQGISETYYWNTPTDDAAAVVYPAAIQLMKWRTLLMGYGVAPVSFRISLLGSFRAYLNSRPEDVRTMPVGPAVVSINTGVPGLPPGVPGTADGSADEANVCLIASAYSGIQNHARKMMAGVPDVMVRTDPNGPFVVGVPSWKSLFDQYVNYLTSNSKWTFKARVPATGMGAFAPAQVQGIQSDPSLDGTFDVLVNTTDGPPFVAGGTVQLRGFIMNSKAYINPNGVYKVQTKFNGAVAGTSWLKIVGSKAWANTQIEFLGSIRAVDFALYPYTSIIPTGQTTRKRGNRSLASPGRRKVVQRVSA